MVRAKLARARAQTKMIGYGNSSSTDNAATVKHTRVTARALRRPCQLSSVSARALAIMPRNSGISRLISSWYQHSNMLPVRAIRTRMA
ncbi:hypothetical protein D3C80_2083210 [compost metagenome]